MSAISNPDLDPKHLAKYISSPSQHIAKQLHPCSHLPANSPAQLCSESGLHEDSQQSSLIRATSCGHGACLPPPHSHDQIPAAAAHPPQQPETETATPLLPSIKGLGAGSRSGYTCPHTATHHEHSSGQVTGTTVPIKLLMQL